MDARTQMMLAQGYGAPAQGYGAPAQGYGAPVAPKTTCCGPCKDKNFCRDDANCCLECHFHYEEVLAFPYIPPEAREILRQQHRWLVTNGFPHDVLEAHAEYEMQWFRPFCPPEIVAQIDADHAEYGEGRLHSRDFDPTVVPAPAPLIYPAPVVGQQSEWAQRGSVNRATLGVAHGYVGRTALGASGYRTWSGS